MPQQERKSEFIILQLQWWRVALKNHFQVYLQSVVLYLPYLWSTSQTPLAQQPNLEEAAASEGKRQKIVLNMQKSQGIEGRSY